MRGSCGPLRHADSVVSQRVGASYVTDRAHGSTRHCLSRRPRRTPEPRRISEGLTALGGTDAYRTRVPKRATAGMNCFLCFLASSPLHTHDMPSHRRGATLRRPYKYSFKLLYGRIVLEGAVKVHKVRCYLISYSGGLRGSSALTHGNSASVTQLFRFCCRV